MYQSLLRARQDGLGRVNGLRLIKTPGVYHPGNDSRLLAEALGAEPLTATDVLELCTGSGFLAIAAAKAGARTVTAVDISPRAVASARLNAAMNRARVRFYRGDLLSGLPEGVTYDVILANPPWLPAATDTLPTEINARALDAGRSGRILIDQICQQAPSRLRPGGVLLVVHGTVCGSETTEALLAAQGLDVSVAARKTLPMTQLLLNQAATLTGPYSWGPEDGTYELVVIRGTRALA
jgi:release factor glutamine methyltransferase